MIKKIELACENCLGFKAIGEITGADYETVLIPNINEKLKNYSKIGLLYQIGDDFEKYEAKAIFDDIKVGFKHMKAFERIAVVSDLDWVINGIHLFHFIFPGKIKTFKNSELEEAKKWISQTPLLTQGLETSIDDVKGVMYFKPLGEITSEDFEYLGMLMDPYIKREKDLKGLIIDTSSFRGYEDFEAFITHFKFVMGHQKHIKKLAILTDSDLVTLAEKIGSIFINAEVKRFEVADKEKAFEWIEE